MMTSKVLIIENSTELGSVAVAGDGVSLAHLTFTSRDHATGTRTEALAPAVAACLAQAGLSPRDLTAIVCGAGPGGFTSLRSAASLAKGMCSALEIPLFAVSSLELLAWSLDARDGTFIAALPAGRNEWFFADVRVESRRSQLVGDAGLVGDADLRERTVSLRAILVGPGLDIDAVPDAAAAIPRLAEIQAGRPVALDSWEPVYGRLAEAQVKWEATHGRPLAR